MKTRFIIVNILFIIIFWNQSVFAQKVDHEAKLSNELIPFVAEPNSNPTVITQWDPLFRDNPTEWNQYNERIANNRITLSIRENVYKPSSFNCTVNIRVSYKSYPSQTAPNIENFALNVNYDATKGATYKASDFYAFQNGYDIEAVVTGINSDIYGSSPPAFLVLKSEYWIDRKKQILTDVPTALSGQIVHPISNPFNKDQSNLDMVWNFSGGTEYDLEWTTVDEESPNSTTANQLSSGTPYPPEEFEPFFKNNATRITTQNQNYSIPLVYNSGYILVRIRMVNYNSENIRVEGAWNYYKEVNNVRTNLVWHLDFWHNSKLNWEYSNTFAEDGKNKAVVSYFDGSLKNRQTVSINNSDQVAMVQESVYDEFGRPVLNILPAPFKQEMSSESTPFLNYISQFNKNAAGNAYTINDISSSSTRTPSTLSNSSGAGFYYSSANTSSTGFNWQTNNNYVPNAEGYPFSMTSYTPDKTGRIKEQGGVGSTFQPGVGDKLTRYYYGKPEQWELDQLFGNDVGYASHYLKNMVLDPNGQLSLSYLNAEGKTIATALAGVSPTNLNALPSSASSIKTKFEKILQPDQFRYDINTKTMMATSVYLANLPGTVNLKYDIEKLASSYPGGLCTSCHYELTISVKDDSGLKIYPLVPTPPIQISSDCAGGLLNGAVNLNLSKIGEYYVTFEYRMDDNAINSLTESYVNSGLSNQSLLSQQSFVQTYLDQTDFGQNVNDCKTCGLIFSDNPLDKSAFISMMVDVLQKNDSLFTPTSLFNSWLDNLYGTLKANCDLLKSSCLQTIPISPCDKFRRQLLDDVSPKGQYALFSNIFSPLEQSLNVIFLHHDAVFGYGGSCPDEIVTREDGTQINTSNLGFTVQDIAKYWKPKWADYFIVFHPEYCKLEFCELHSDLYAWDNILENDINSLAELTQLYPSIQYPNNSNSINIDWLLSKDPFFNSVMGTQYFQPMHVKLQNFSTTIENLANSAPVKDLNGFVDFLIYNKNEIEWANFDSNVSITDACRIRDREFSLYKNYYLNLRRGYIDELRSSTTCQGVCPVGVKSEINTDCIPRADFKLQQEDDPNTPLGQKAIKIIYNGQLTYPVNVKLYSPAEYGNLVPESIQINQNPMIFYVDNQVSVDAIKIKAIDCGNSNCDNTTTDFEVDYLNSYDSDCGTNYAKYYVFVKPCAKMCAGDIPTDAQVFVTYESYSTSYGTYYHPSREEGPFNVYFDSSTITNNDPHTIYGTVCVPYNSNNNYDNNYNNNYDNNYNNNHIKSVRTEGKLSSCTPICNEILEFKTSRFDNNSVAPTEIPSNSAQLIQDDVSETCDANADNWMQSLVAGLINATPQQKTDLRTALVSICTSGGDESHPFGATTLAPGQSGTYTSFGDAIKAIILGGGAFTPSINPWLIESPFPYNVNPQFNRVSVGSVKQPLINRINEIRNLVGNPSTTTAFYNALVTYFGKAMTITENELASLLDIANAQCTTDFLNKDITLPLFLDPNNKGFISRVEYDAALAEMKGQIAGLAINDPNYEKILGGFMNQKFGFGMAYFQYDDFANGNQTLLVNIPTSELNDPDLLINYSVMVKDAAANGKRDFEDYLMAERLRFKDAYISSCSSAKATASIVSTQQIYHFTLYYYDLAGNLLRTVPPQGVSLLNETQTNQVALSRRVGDASNCLSPLLNAIVDKPASLNQLSSHLDSDGDNSIEFWLYNSTGGSSQTLLFSNPSGNGYKDYMLQLCINGGLANVEIYKITQTSNSSLSFVLSNYVTISTNDAAMAEWNHVVIQGTNLKAGILDLYINGKKGSPISGSPPAGCSWSVSDPANPPEFLDKVKYLRFYTRKLSASEISANAASACFNPMDMASLTYRFNVPAAGSVTTVGGNTTESISKYIFPVHHLITTYAYNATNQVVQQQTPDAGKSVFFYDQQSRLIASQNAKQLAYNNNTNSYTLYDDLGRINEVGEKSNLNLTSLPTYLDYDSFKVSVNTNPDNNKQITKTYYDLPIDIAGGPNTDSQENTRKRVAASVFTENENLNNVNATYYSYDIDGNVKTLWQQLNGLELKRLDYQYDLVSGKVNMVAYQHNQLDRFYYKYKYDADNRLTEAWSGIDAIWRQKGGSYLLGGKMDAKYKYYFHGPLSRMELGEELYKVQGIDYAYTLQGWLKGINSTNLVQSSDIGKDGLNGSDNYTIPKDVFGYSLHYYGTDDYKAIGGTSVKPFAEGAAAGFGFNALYNGNIAGMSINNPSVGIPLLYTYKYDQLNRLNKTYAYQGLNNATNSWNVRANQNFRETFNYDANGNIIGLLRNGNTAIATTQVMDNLTYSYNMDANGNLLNNRLRRVHDTIDPTAYADDLDDQTNIDNYDYDEIGNLKYDHTANNTLAVQWNVYGKIKSILKNDTQPINYAYDASGNRVFTDKTIFNNGNINTDKTWYLRDGQGNPIAIYKRNAQNITYLAEVNLYGSSRLGVFKPFSANGNELNLAWETANKKQYELTNHLGNVMATISGDFYVNSNNDREAIVLNATDYYAFGAPMPGRTYTAPNQESYRYGFNGQEKSDEISGAGNHNTAEFWEYDTRLGRRWNLDPKPVSGVSDYATFLNNPIWTTDALGDTTRLSFDGKTNKLTIYGNTTKNSLYIKLGEFDAHNNVVPGSKGGKWEDGNYEMRDKLTPTKHGNQEDQNGIKKDSRGGAYGIFGDYVANGFKQSDGKFRLGMAIHAGRIYNNDIDNVGSPTNGCIRVSEVTMMEINASIYHYGQLESITILNNKNRLDNQSVSQPYKNKTPTFRIPTNQGLEIKIDNLRLKPVFIYPNLR